MNNGRDTTKKTSLQPPQTLPDIIRCWDRRLIRKTTASSGTMAVTGHFDVTSGDRKAVRLYFGRSFWPPLCGCAARVRPWISSPDTTLWWERRPFVD